MRVYVIGAGVSCTAGYPLGGALLDEVDRFIRSLGHLTYRVNWRARWPEMCEWFATNPNVLIAESFRARRLEHLFTILDLAVMMREQNLADWFSAGKGGHNAAVLAEAAYSSFHRFAEEYRENRRDLLFALELFFRSKHEQDHVDAAASEWTLLRNFAKRVSAGDVVITFNYDATIERVLLAAGKWSPKDGYGFDLVFRKSAYDDDEALFESSATKILHLHGATGWYTKPVFAPGYDPTSHDGAISRDALAPAPIETPISLDPSFLQCLGVDAVDACMPLTPPQESQVLIHPTFLKDYELEGKQNLVFEKLWRLAGEALRVAEEVTVIGYSLPTADSAALSLLVTNCTRSRVRVINTNWSVTQRLRRLLSSELTITEVVSFEEWLASSPAA